MEYSNNIIVDVIPWFRGFPWNLAGAYYSWLCKLNINGIYNDFNRYCFDKNFNSNIIFLMGPHYTSKMCSEDNVNFFIKIIKEKKIKLVLFEYESLFNCDYSSNYIYNNLHYDEVSNNNSKDRNNNKNWINLISNADLLIVSDPRDEYIISNKMFSCDYYCKTISQPYCVDTDVFTENMEKINKICFFGSSAGDRVNLINNIKNNCLFDIHHTSYDWDITYEQKKKDIINYVNIVSKYLVNINTKSMAAGIQNRIYETMAVNRFCVSHKPTNLPGRQDIWKNIKNVIWYNDYSEIISICTDVVNNEEKYSYILKNCREEVLKNFTPEINIRKAIDNL